MPHAGGRIATGRYMQVEAQLMANLFVSMLGHYGLPTEGFGDSTSQKLSLA
ncbi:MAG: hypothetical protein ACOVLE_07215 [Pirellula staleyi]